MTLRLDITITGLDRIAEAILALAGGMRQVGSQGRAHREDSLTGMHQEAPGCTSESVSPAAIPTAPVTTAPTAAPVGPVPTAPTTAPATPTPIVPTAVAATSLPASPAVAAAPTAPTSGIAPQTAPVQSGQPSYSLDELAAAAMTLMDSDPRRTDDLQALLRSFGVETLPSLPRAQYGAFATALRGMGARI